jgi:hypothetical protein
MIWLLVGPSCVGLQLLLCTSAWWMCTVLDSHGSEDKFLYFFGLLRLVVWWSDTEVSEDHAASIFSVESESLRWWQHGHRRRCYPTVTIQDATNQNTRNPNSPTLYVHFFMAWCLTATNLLVYLNETTYVIN